MALTDLIYINNQISNFISPIVVPFDLSEKEKDFFFFLIYIYIFKQIVKILAKHFLPLTLPQE